MTAKLFKSQFKSMIIPAVIFATVLILTAYILGSSAEVFQYSQIIEGMEYIQKPSFNSLLFFIAACFGSTAFGIVVSSYRYSLKKADLFFQIPYKEGTIKRTRTLVGLIYTVGITIIAFGILVLAFSIHRMIAKPGYLVAEGFNAVKASFNPEIFLLQFAFSVVMVASCYFIATFSALQTSSVANSILVSLEIFVIIGLFSPTINNLICAFSDYRVDLPINVSLGYIMGVSSVYSQISSLFYAKMIVFETGTALANILISVIGTILLGIGGAIGCFIQKEKSAELCGRGDVGNIFQRLVHHTAWALALSALVYMSRSDTIAIFCLLLVYIGANYFLVTALLFKTFKMSKKDWIPLVCSCTISLILSIVFMFIG